MEDNKVQLSKDTSIDAARKLKKVGFDIEVDGKEVNIDENDTMLDLFPEITEEKPMDGGEVKDIKQKPKNKNKKNEIKKTEKKIKKENFMTKKELLESIGIYDGGAPAPAKPTTKPTTKPGTRPTPNTPKTPFKPSISPKPKADGGLPSWLSADALGIGSGAPAPAKPTTKPTTKPGTRPTPNTPKTPFKPSISPKPKAEMVAEQKNRNKRKK